VGESVNTVTELTVSEMILLAAMDLEEHGESPFSAESLIVTSWQKYPRTFGLKGYADQYPDSNKVLASIMGQKGLARRSWLVKMGQKLYALTREGREAGRQLMHGEEEPAPVGEVVTLVRDQEKFLQGLFASTALQKFQEGRKQELTFADGCRFWGITENLRGDVLDARMDRFRDNLADVKRALGNASATLSNGRSVEPEDIAELGQVHTYLNERFSRHLNLLRTRSIRN
jgi:hypothetical protein